MGDDNVVDRAQPTHPRSRTHWVRPADRALTRQRRIGRFPIRSICHQDLEHITRRSLVRQSPAAQQRENQAGNNKEQSCLAPASATSPSWRVSGVACQGEDLRYGARVWIDRREERGQMVPLAPRLLGLLDTERHAGTNSSSNSSRRGGLSPWSISFAQKHLPVPVDG